MRALKALLPSSQSHAHSLWRGAAFAALVVLIGSFGVLQAPPARAAVSGGFHLEEATIAQIQNAILDR